MARNKGFELYFYVGVGVGMALGTSVFTMVAGLFEVASLPWVLIGLVISGLFCAGISLSIAELASMFPSAPGIRTYLKAAFGNQASLVVVYAYLGFVVLIAGVESYMFALVAAAVLPGISPTLIVSVLVVAVIGVNLLGLELPRTLQVITTSLLVLALLTFGVWGLATAEPGSLGLRLGDWGDAAANLALLPAVAGMAVFLFMGFEWVTPLGFRPQSYKWRIPISMPVAIGLLMLTYGVFVLAIGGRMERAAIAAESVPQVPYLVHLFGPRGVYGAGLLSFLAIFTTFNAGVLGGSRLLYAVAREGNLPDWVCYMNLNTGVPVGSILTLGTLAAISAAVVLTFELELVAAIIGACIICIVYAAFVGANIRLRFTRPDARRHYRSPVPLWIQWVLALVLPVMGIQTLFSDPDLRPRLLVGISIVVVLSAALAWYSARRTAEEPASA